MAWWVGRQAGASALGQEGPAAPAPDVIAAEIVEDLKAALEQFAEIQVDLSKTS
jgi:hypothetical protein